MIVEVGPYLLEVIICEENETLEADIRVMRLSATGRGPIGSIQALGTKLDEMAESYQSKVIRVVCPSVEIANEINEVLLFSQVRLGYTLRSLPRLRMARPCVLVSADMFNLDHFTRFFLACFRPSDLGLATKHSVMQLASDLKSHHPIEGVEHYCGYIVQRHGSNIGLIFVEPSDNGICRLGPVGLAPRYRKTAISAAFWSAALSLLTGIGVNQIRFEIDADNRGSRLIARSRSCELVHCSLVQHTKLV